MVAPAGRKWQGDRHEGTLAGPAAIGSLPMSETPAWIRRYTATSFGFPSWAVTSPERLALVTNRSGAWQAWTYDRATGALRQVSHEPVGVESVFVLPDGRVAWWHDTTGDEAGHLVATPFEDDAPVPVLLGVPDGWPMGISFAANRVALGLAVEGEYRVYVAELGDTARLVHAGASAAGVGRESPEGSGGLSADATLLCIRHTGQGSILHYALRVLDVGSGEIVGDLVDAGRRLDPGAWSPVPGDQRLAFTSELSTFERPAIWDVATRERRDLEADLPGAVFPVDWYPDGSALLVRHEHEGRGQLYRLDLPSGEIELIADPSGDIEETAVRPDGEVWFRASDGVRPPRVLAADGTEVLPRPDAPAPAGRPLRPVWFTNPRGNQVQSFVVTPEGGGPFPTVMSVHGGPEWHERDRFDPEVQAFVDAGYAVALINYRGSTGYGIAFREALIGNPCFPESEDVLACLDTLIADGVADPGRVYWSGWSWGGCLACLNAGLHPERWRAMFAGIPAGDFVAAHWASAPALQAWDDAVYGGSPDEVPDAYRLRDPMTYVDQVRAPILVIAGENDSRCPIEGVTPWVEAVRANGGEVEVHLYATGHHANSMDEQVRHMQLVLDFFARHA